MPRFALLIPLLLSALLLACGGDDDSDDAASSPAAAASPQPTAAEDKPTQETAPAGVTDEPVRFETADGVTASGQL